MNSGKMMSLLACILMILILVGCGDNTDPVSNNEGNGNSGDISDIGDNSDIVQITLNGNSISVNGKGATVSGKIVTIESAGTYSISGSLSDGQIIVDTEDEDAVKLVLNGVNINCSTSAPINIAKSQRSLYHPFG